MMNDRTAALAFALMLLVCALVWLFGIQPPTLP